uniref:Uncharacterized protein n=1 Tax=Candidatus Kentrum sp. UNK TaxID=2126344 RepID=A0A451B0A0_9GAMM|nr:MAG: hypothetical protein BECKUNK1418H_GA0071006_10797 [Candidatus Kentron sp. UNK]
MCWITLPLREFALEQKDVLVETGRKILLRQIPVEICVVGWFLFDKEEFGLYCEWCVNITLLTIKIGQGFAGLGGLQQSQG